MITGHKASPSRSIPRRARVCGRLRGRVLHICQPVTLGAQALQWEGLWLAVYVGVRLGSDHDFPGEREVCVPDTPRYRVLHSRARAAALDPIDALGRGE